MRVRSSIGVVAIVLVMFGAGVVQAEKAELSDVTPVIIAEDKTKESDCKSFVGSPQNEQPCKPGSVIFARQTTYSEVKARGINKYSILTNNAKMNEQLQDKLVADARDALVGSSPDAQGTSLNESFHPQAVCTQKGFWVGSNYLSNPNNAASTRIFWEMKYTRQADCRITQIVDRGKVSQLTYVWWRSCVNTGADCTNRSIIMDAIDWKPRPPAWQGMAFDSFFGREYWHISDKACTLCGQPYGLWRFDDQ
jgi:hypothetical protein